MKRAFLIKYGEIALKGKNRRIFEDVLVKRIRQALDSVDGTYKIERPRGRIFIEPETGMDELETIEALKCVFGIVAICPVIMVEDEGFEALAEHVVDFFGESFNDRSLTFKVDSRRSRKNYPLNSMELNADLGERLLMAYPQLKVDVHNPKVLVRVEVRDNISIYVREIPGPGGMPIGTNGSAQLLLSGGIDSPVAGYMIAKRGVTVHATYFHAPPYTSERARQKVEDLARILSRYLGSVTLHVVNFTDIQMTIYEKCPHDELTIIMRRYMMKIAEHFAKCDGDLGLVTGESIGQVASQTMQSLACTDAATSMPVYRPLIGFDKQEIVDVSERIGTYDTSILPYEDCCTIFVAKHPVTRPRIERILKSEENLYGVIEDLVTKAIEETDTVEIS